MFNSLVQIIEYYYISSTGSISKLFPAIRFLHFVDLEELIGARVSLESEVVVLVTGTLSALPNIFVERAVIIRWMIITNILKEVDFVSG